MTSRLLIFVLVVSILVLYTFFKISFFLPDQILWAWFLTVAIFIVMMGWQFAYRVNSSRPASPPFTLLAWIGGLVLGLWATFILVSIPFDLIHAAIFGYHNWIAKDPLSYAGQGLFVFWIPTVTLGLAIFVTALGFREVVHGPRIYSVKVPMPHLPESFAGLRIAQISDLHVGPTVQIKYVQKVVQRVLDLKPDLIAITGDLADGTPESLREHLQPLFDLKAPHGVYYVTGNHEYYWGGESWVAQSRRMGFTPLMNENKILQINGAAVMVAGVTDTSAHHFEATHKSDPAKAVQSDFPSDLKILLSHRPDSYKIGSSVGFHLQLSGHTHAGQFFPWSLVMPLAHLYYKGLNRHEDLWVYVNAGTGYWGPPHRFLIPSEITLLHISRD